MKAKWTEKNKNKERDTLSFSIKISTSGNGRATKWMEMGHTFFRIPADIWDNFPTGSEKDSGFWWWHQETNIKGIGNKILEKGEGNNFTQIWMKPMMESLWMTWGKEKESISTKLETNTTGSGRTIKKVGKEWSYILTGIFSEATGKRIRSWANHALWCSKMVILFRVLTKVELKWEKESMYFIRGRS